MMLSPHQPQGTLNTLHVKSVTAESCNYFCSSPSSLTHKHAPDKELHLPIWVLSVVCWQHIND